jgi:hypothetical protein
MKKKSEPKKLQLNRETLRALKEEQLLQEVAGGFTGYRCGYTNGPTLCTRLC